MRQLAVVASTLIVTAAALAAAGCDDVTGGGGPRQLIFDQRVCIGQGLYRMRLDQTHRVIVRNTEGSTGQTQLTLRFERVPLVVDGDVPDKSTIGDPFSTIVIEAPIGEERSIDVIPRRTGEYRMECSWFVQGDVSATGLRLQIIDEGS
jgi:hypothetical protein